MREEVQAGHICVKHIAGELNVSDLFTEEDKDVQHFIQIVNHMMEMITPRT